MLLNMRLFSSTSFDGLAMRPDVIVFWHSLCSERQCDLSELCLLIMYDGCSLFPDTFATLCINTFISMLRGFQWLSAVGYLLYDVLEICAILSYAMLYDCP